ncbi:DUF6527 family protein [Pseudomonas viridiflava]|uniref:DUF6527 family protein n=1 Tax=Pseudomonas viridiflava TaxID=33069 RepID=UPI000F032133
MMRYNQLTPCFVKGVPRELEPGILYVSMEYGTVVHSCCCGCGLEVVTPLTPTDWKLTYDGESISLWPSVGNWNLPCRSHYVVNGSRVIEAEPWDKARIEAEQRRDKAAKALFYANTAELVALPKKEMQNSGSAPRVAQKGMLEKLLGWFR